MKTIKDIDVKNKVILLRTDYNVPIENGTIENDLRIRASLPTINYLLDQGAKRIFIISHLGRPEGKENFDYTLSPVAKDLQKLLSKQTVGFYPLPKSPDPIKDIPQEIKIALLENLRFYPGEEANDLDFIKNIVEATGAEIYIQDGFAVTHRAHASTDAIKNVLPVYAGLLVEKEISNLEKIIKSPKKPVLVIIGGAKVEDKQPLIDKFTKVADNIVVGGKIAADGYQTKDDNIYVAEDFDENSAGEKLDIGPLATAKLANLITEANTIIWNGLLGKAEDPAYATASTIAAKLIGEKHDATTVICGGDTTGFVEHLITEHQDLTYSLVSTGGGAALEFLLGKEMPGLKAILS